VESVTDGKPADGIVSYARLCAGATAAVLNPVDQSVGGVLVASADGVERVADEVLADALARGVQAAGVGRHDPVMELRTLADPAARAFVYGAIEAGAVVHLGRDPRLVLADLREARPLVLHSDAATLQRVKRDADTRAAAIAIPPLARRLGMKTGLKRAAWEAGLRRARKVGPRRVQRRTNIPLLLVASAVLAVALLIYSGATSDSDARGRVGIPALAVLVFGVAAALAGRTTARPLRNRYGLGRARVVVAGDLPSPETLDWYWGFGVPILRSETTGPGFLAAVARPD
jgi:hypothetical protein